MTETLRFEGAGNDRRAAIPDQFSRMPGDVSMIGDCDCVETPALELESMLPS
jgi:hypothetical protein